MMWEENVVIFLSCSSAIPSWTPAHRFALIVRTVLRHSAVETKQTALPKAWGCERVNAIGVWL